MSNLDVQIEDTSKQVAEAQNKITEFTSRIEAARAKMGTDIEGAALDIETASLADVQAHADAMNGNIAELIMGLDDVTSGFSKDFDEPLVEAVVENSGRPIRIIQIIPPQELDTPRFTVRQAEYENGRHEGFDGLFDHLVALVVVGFQVIDLDRVVLALCDALHVCVVPEDGDRAAGVQSERLMARDLDQLSRFDRLIPAWFQVKNLKCCVLILLHNKMQDIVTRLNVKDICSSCSYFPESLTLE